MQTLSLSITPAQTAAWRKQIFQQLTERTKRELENFQHYEQAVEQVRNARGTSSSRHPLSACCTPAPRRVVRGPTVLPAQRTWPRLGWCGSPCWAQNRVGPQFPHPVQRVVGC